MCNCHSILKCCVIFSGVKLSIRLFNLFRIKLRKGHVTVIFHFCQCPVISSVKDQSKLKSYQH